MAEGSEYQRLKRLANGDIVLDRSARRKGTMMGTLVALHLKKGSSASIRVVDDKAESLDNRASSNKQVLKDSKKRRDFEKDKEKKKEKKKKTPSEDGDVASGLNDDKVTAAVADEEYELEEMENMDSEADELPDDAEGAERKHASDADVDLVNLSQSSEAEASGDEEEGGDDNDEHADGVDSDGDIDEDERLEEVEEKHQAATRRKTPAARARRGAALKGQKTSRRRSRAKKTRRESLEDEEGEKDERKKRHSSFVREFFQEDDKVDGLFHCRLTPYASSITVGISRQIVSHTPLVKQSGSSTSHLVEHARKFHLEQFLEMQKAYAEGKDVETEFAAMLKTLESEKEQKKLVALRAKEADRRVSKVKGRVRKEVALLLWFVNAHIPFHVIESEQFETFLRECDVKLDCRTTIMKLLPVVYAVALQFQEDQFRKCASYALTFDLWTSVAQQKYFILTYHGITSEFEMIHAALDLVPIDGSAVGSLLALVVNERVRAHGFDTMLLGAVVSDSGANVRKAKTLLVPGDGEPCFNHLLKSMWGDVLERPTDPVAAKDFNAMSSLISCIRMTPSLRNLMRNLQEKEGDDALQFIAANITRWEGRYLSLERFLKLKDFLVETHKKECFAQYLDFETFPEDFLCDEYFVRLNGYLKILKIAHEISVCAQGQTYPTSSSVCMWVNELLSETQPTKTDGKSLKVFKQAVHNAVEERLGFFLSRPTNALKAGLLDPRFASFLEKLISPSLFDEAWQAIANDVLEIYDEAERELESQIWNAQVASVQNSLRNSDLTSEDPPEKALKWWKSLGIARCEVFKLAARLFLCIPAGSARSEQGFSQTSLDVTRLRTRMGDLTLEQLVVIQSFVKSNTEIPFDEFFERLLGIVNHTQYEEVQKQLPQDMHQRDLTKFGFGPVKKP